MKTIVLLAISVLVGVTVANAQGTLQFNQVKIVAAQETVPVGKVWKIEAMWGAATEECWDTPCSACWGNSTKTIGVRRTFKINGEIAYQELTRKIGYGNGSCTSINTSCGDVCLGTVPNRDNPIFPVWVPEGTTVEGVGNTKVSLIEFNVIP